MKVHNKVYRNYISSNCRKYFNYVSGFKLPDCYLPPLQPEYENRPRIYYVQSRQLCKLQTSHECGKMGYFDPREKRETRQGAGFFAHLPVVTHFVFFLVTQFRSRCLRPDFFSARQIFLVINDPQFKTFVQELSTLQSVKDLTSS